MNKERFLKGIAAALILGIMISPAVTARANVTEGSLVVSLSSRFSRAPRNAYGQKSGTYRLKLSRPSSKKKAVKNSSGSRKTKKKSATKKKSKQKTKSKTNAKKKIRKKSNTKKKLAS